MTTRHTISHADELYAGNAYKSGYSPDGRRGIKMTHMYAHEFITTSLAVVAAADVDGILSSYANATLLSPTAIGTGANFLSLCTGALVSAGSTILAFDLPRNIVWQVSGSNATKAILNVEGLDDYGDAMVECIKGATQTVAVSGVRAFKSINKIYLTGATVAYTTRILDASAIISAGTGDRLGLPFHLADVGKFISLSVDGYPMQPSNGNTSGVYEVYAGIDNTTTVDSTPGDADVRGTVRPISPAPDGTKRFTALMIVDHTTSRKAFGAPQCTAVTYSY